MIESMESGVELASTRRTRASAGYRVVEEGTAVTARQAAWLGLSVVAVAVGLASLTSLFVVPTIFGDELRYWEAARSLSEGDGLSIRGGDYGYGPVYPAVLAPLIALLTVSGAFLAAKLLNAVLFALAAVPVYFLARRVVGHPWALGVSVLAVSAPVAVYTGLILTESVTYPLCCGAILAMTLAFERPTWRRQSIVLVAIGVTVLARAQLGVLGVALVVGYLVRHRHEIRHPRAFVRRFLPTVCVLGLIALALTARLATQGPAALGGYADLLRTNVSPLAGIVWSWWTAGALVLALAAVPALLLPSTVRLLRSGPPERRITDAAFLLCLVSVTSVVLVSVGFFSSTPEALGVIHERYFFYLLPLWLIAIAVWADRSGSLTRKDLLWGCALAFLLVATLPPGLRKTNSTVWLEWPSGSLWAFLDGVTPSGGFAVSLVVAVAVVGLSVVAVRVSQRWTAAIFAPIVVLFVANGMLGWIERIAIAQLDEWSYVAQSSDWVDSAVGTDARVLTLFPGSRACSQLLWQRAMLYTEFENASIERAVHIRRPSAPVIDSTPVVVRHDGSVADLRGNALSATFALAPRGVRLDGRLLATGHNGLLRLWAVNGEVSVVGAASSAEMLAAACPTS